MDMETLLEVAIDAVLIAVLVGLIFIAPLML